MCGFYLLSKVSREFRSFLNISPSILPLVVAFATPTTKPGSYDLQRGVNIAQELLARATGAASSSDRVSERVAVAALKADVLRALDPFGDPALNVPPDVAAIQIRSLQRAW